MTTLPDHEGKDGTPDLKGFGIGKSHFFWIKEGKPDPQAVHVGFVAKNHSEVDACYKAALAAGGKSKKPPQARPEYYPGYYATWVLDPDGHDIESSIKASRVADTIMESAVWVPHPRGFEGAGFEFSFLTL